MSTPVVTSSGSQTAVVGTEHVLYTSGFTGTFQLWVDISAMQAGDTLELRTKTKVLGGGAVGVVLYQIFSGAASVDDALQYSIPVPCDQAASFTLKQTAGVGRVYPWKVLAL